MTEAWRLTLGEGLGRLSDGSLTAGEWIRSLLARIDGRDAEIKAWVSVPRPEVLAAADALDARRAEERGPLAGAPIGVKDLIAVEGLAWEAGSPLYAGRMAETDAAAATALRASGALILGKTTTCELGTNAPSPTRNPWNPAHSPGGSSSGSAAAVAAGMVPAALGTQTGGSVLRPAAYCGVLGFKPTYGEISRDGVVPLSWSLDTLGVLTRSAPDAATLFAALAEHPPGSALRAPRRPRRVLFLKDDFLPRASREVADWTLRAVARLRDAGIAVDDGRLPEDLESVHSAHRVVVRAESASHYGDLFRERPEAFGPDIRNNILSGLMIPAVYYLKALRLRARFIDRLDGLLGRYDLAVAPATMDTAPLAEASTGNPLFNEPFSFSGHPAVTLPLGRGERNLPIGLQLVGARKGDQELLAVARWCEAELGWRARIAEMERSPETMGDPA